MEERSPTIEDLKDPDFMQHARTLYPNGHVEPDAQDFDEQACVGTNAQMVHQYRLAQGRKLMRFWRQ